MIEIMKNWASEIVVSLVIVTLIEMLLPDNKTKKYVKTVIGIYIMYCIISPFIDKAKFTTILEDTEKRLEKIQIESKVSTAMVDKTESIEMLYIEEFEKDVKRKVEELGYEVNVCKVDVEIDATKENAGINGIYLKIKDKKIKNEENNNLQINNIEKVEISIKDLEEGKNIKEETEAEKKVKEYLSNYYEIDEAKIQITQT